MSTRTTAVNVRLAPADVQKLRRLARPRERLNGERGRETMSATVRRLIREAAEPRGERKPA